MAPTSASAPVMYKSSFIPLAKLDLTAPSSCRRSALGTALKAEPVWPWRTALMICWAWAFSCGTGAKSRARSCLREELKIVPSAAMLTAMPIWRNVVFTPEAIPARSRFDHADRR